MCVQSNVIFLHRRLLQTPVGSSCRLGPIGERRLVSRVLPSATSSPGLFPLQVLFCADLKKFQKLKETSRPKKKEEEEEEEAEKEKEKKEEEEEEEEEGPCRSKKMKAGKNRTTKKIKTT